MALVTDQGTTGGFPLEVVGVDGPTPSIFAAAAVPSVAPFDSRSASADGQLLYDIEIICSSGCAPTVAYDMTGFGFVTSLAIGTASSEAKVTVGATTIDVTSTNGGAATGSGPGLLLSGSSFSYTTQLLLVPNFVYSVLLEADANASTLSGPQSASAYNDPFFFIDPSVPNAAQYSILTSPGIGNSPVVPEPSTWMMLLTGMAGLGLLKPIVGRRSILLPPPSLPALTEGCSRACQTPALFSQGSDRS